MTPLEETLRGLLIVYERKPHTRARREQLMNVVKKVLDYFIPQFVI